MGALRHSFMENNQSGVEPIEQSGGCETPIRVDSHSSRSLDTRIQSVLDLIHHGLNRQYAVPDLAAHVNLSDSYFYHLFRREMKISPNKYMEALRLREAEHLIRTTCLSIKEVCTFVGINDRSHFIRNFKQAYGL